MITAHFANEYNRTVLAIPGSVNSSFSAGTNQLIRDGATIVNSVDDVAEEFESLFLISRTNIKHRESPKRIPVIEGNEKILYELITEPVTIDQLAETSNISVEKVITAMLMLELKGLVRMLPGKMYTKK